MIILYIYIQVPIQYRVREGIYFPLHTHNRSWFSKSFSLISRHIVRTYINMVVNVVVTKSLTNIIFSTSAIVRCDFRQPRTILHKQRLFIKVYKNNERSTAVVMTLDKMNIILYLYKSIAFTCQTMYFLVNGFKFSKKREKNGDCQLIYLTTE